VVVCGGGVRGRCAPAVGGGGGGGGGGRFGGLCGAQSVGVIGCLIRRFRTQAPRPAQARARG